MNVSSDAQPLNALSPMVTNVGSISTSARAVQFSKALSPISVTLMGSEMLVRPVHPLNASAPIDSREVHLSRSISVIPAQFWNALPLIISSDLGSTTSVNAEQP